MRATYQHICEHYEPSILAWVFAPLFQLEVLHPNNARMQQWRKQDIPRHLYIKGGYRWDEFCLNIQPEFSPCIGAAESYLVYFGPILPVQVCLKTCVGAKEWWLIEFRLKKAEQKTMHMDKICSFGLKKTQKPVWLVALSAKSHEEIWGCLKGYSTNVGLN